MPARLLSLTVLSYRTDFTTTKLWKRKCFFSSGKTDVRERLSGPRDYPQTCSGTVWRMTERPAGCKQLSEPPFIIHCSLAKHPCKPATCTRSVHEKASWCVSLNHPFSLTGVHVGSLHRNGAEKLYIPKIFWLRFLFSPLTSQQTVATTLSPNVSPHRTHLKKSQWC